LEPTVAGRRAAIERISRLADRHTLGGISWKAASRRWAKVLMAFLVDASAALTRFFADKRTAETQALPLSLKRDFAVTPANWPSEMALNQPPALLNSCGAESRLE
jgi:hypothetical protein